jgi:uncharacterized protein with PQ loop repeat
VLSASVVGSAATAITVMQVGRQVYDARSTPNPLGISLTSWLLGLAQSTGIFVLAVGHTYTEAIVANALVGVGCCAIISIAGRKRGVGWIELSAMMTTLVATIVVLGIVVSPGFAGVLGDAAAVVLWLPQAVRLMRAPQVLGLSLPFFVAGFVSSALWIAYAVLLHQWRLGVPPASALIALATAAFFAYRGHTAQESFR